MNPVSKGIAADGVSGGWIELLPQCKCFGHMPNIVPLGHFTWKTGRWIHIIQPVILIIMCFYTRKNSITKLKKIRGVPMMMDACRENKGENDYRKFAPLMLKYINIYLYVRPIPNNI